MGPVVVCAAMKLGAFVLLHFSAWEGSSHFWIAAAHAKELQKPSKSEQCK